MSIKLKYQDIVEVIAQQTARSENFTRNYLSDLIDAVREGLEADGKVNIAQFGKFELKQVEAKEGYNPQTDQKKMIPAHQRVVFKPYKKVRKLVNAPYEHMESKIIDTKHQADESTFIPEAPPTDVKSTFSNDTSSDDYSSKERTAPGKEPLQNGTKWLGVAAAVIAASAGAWFFFRRDE